jgi:DNA-binding transcriptional LysR family regulator
MLDVRRMRVLREVASRGSFSAAADALAYTQSAVSQQIAALEREAGTRLVERNARGVRLTDAGRALVEHAEAILARLADAEAELEAIAGLRGGRLRLASFPSAGATIMPEAIARFRERHPGVELTLEPAEPEPSIVKMRTGEVDLVLDITAGFREPGDDGIERLHLLDDPMYVALPPGHPLARKRNLKLEELAAESWILGTTGSCPDASIFLRSCQLAGFEPNVTFNSDDYFAIQGFVAAGMGASFIPDLALISVRADIVVRSLGPRPPVRVIWAAALKDSYCSPARQAMLEVLVEVGREFSANRRTLALAS